MLCVQVSVSDGSKSDSDTFTVADPFAQKAYDLDQQLGLHTYPNGTYYANARGAGEKYLLGNGNGLYFLLPNGALYRWGGSIAGSTLVATLSADYYANPALLYQAQSPAAVAAAAAATASSLSVRAVENTATVDVVGGGAEASADAALRFDRRGDGVAWPAKTAIGSTRRGAPRQWPSPRTMHWRCRCTMKLSQGCRWRIPSPAGKLH